MTRKLREATALTPVNEVELPPTLASSYGDVCQEILRLTALRDVLREQIEAALGEAEYALVNGVPALRWQHITNHRLNMGALKAAVDPATLAACYEDIPGRRLIAVKPKATDG